MAKLALFLLLPCLIVCAHNSNAKSVAEPDPLVRCEDGPCDVSTLVNNCTLPEGTEVEVFGRTIPPKNTSAIPPDYKDPATGTYLYGERGRYKENGKIHNYTGEEKIRISTKKLNVVRYNVGWSARGKIHYCGKTICALTDTIITERNTPDPIEIPKCAKQKLVEHLCQDTNCWNGKCEPSPVPRDCSYWECDPPEK